FLASDSCRFILVYFSQMDGAVGQPNAGDSLSFAPTAASIDSSQSPDFTDSRACGERLDLRNIAQNLEVHSTIVAKRCNPVNADANCGAGTRVRRPPQSCSGIFASCTTLAKRTMSASKRAANSSGVLPTPSLPPVLSRSSTSGALSAFAVSRWMMFTTSRGVPAGTNNPCQLVDSKPGIVSATVGTPGRARGRRAP